MSCILSLFPGIGLLDMAFEMEGETIVRGPDPIWGGDIRRFHPPPRKFDGVIGGPPCQMFSSLARLVEANGHTTKFGNLIPEFERCVAEAECDWFLMENVEAAPIPVVAGYSVKAIILDNSHIAGDDGFGQEQRRIRRFCFGVRGREATNLMKWIDLAVFFLPDTAKTVCGSTSSNQGCLGSSKVVKTRKVSTDGGTRPSEQRTLHPTIHGGHGQPPGSKTRKRAVTSNVGGVGNGPGSPKPASGSKAGRYKLADALRLQGLPEDFLDHCPFTAEGKLKAVANGVPIPMGRAIARAVKEALAQ